MCAHLFMVVVHRIAALFHFRFNRYITKVTAGSKRRSCFRAHAYNHIDRGHSRDPGLLIYIPTPLHGQPIRSANETLSSKQTDGTTNAVFASVGRRLHNFCLTLYTFYTSLRLPFDKGTGEGVSSASGTLEPPPLPR